MLKIGLTGGIACGKTTVAELFAERGIPVLDADLIARRLVEPGQPALGLIADRFGPDILAGDQLNRTRLRDIVFADPEQRRWLESLLHPLVYAEMTAATASLSAPYGLLVVPLLLETGRRDLVDRLLVVDCPELLQRRRLAERDRLAEAEIDRILAAQVSREQRLAAADEVIENEGSPCDLQVAVQRLHQDYLALAAAASSPERRDTGVHPPGNAL